MKLSVVICTHNPRRDVLGRVLVALHAQTLPSASWELLIVDNASTPLLQLPTAKLPLHTRTISEPTPGQMHARVAGIHAAGSDLVVFVDDDNVLQPDYLAEALRFMEEHPQVGAAGGRVEPEFEIPAPAWISKNLELLAVRDLGPTEILTPEDHAPNEYPWWAPFGAGMIIRRACAARYAQAVGAGTAKSVGRTGNTALGSCDDSELVLHGVLSVGMHVAYSPRLRLTHLIPPRRLYFRYLHRLAYETGVSWGDFCVRNEYLPPIPRWSVPLRAARLFLRQQAWTPGGWLAWRSDAGRMVGRSHRIS